MKKIIVAVVIIVLLVILSLAFFMKKNIVENTDTVIHNSKTGISFEYPVGWNRFGKMSTGFMLSSPEEKSMLIFNYSDSNKTKETDLNQVVVNFLYVFDGDANYNLISDKNIKIGDINAREIIFSYDYNGRLLKTKFVLLDKYKGIFHHFSLRSSESFEKDLIDFNKIIESVVFK